MSEILKGKHFKCLQNYSESLEMIIGWRLLYLYLVLSLDYLFVVSQGPIRPVSYHVTSFSRLLKQQIAVFVPYNFLSKLSTDIVTFSNIPAANIWYFLSPSSLPLTPTLPQPPAKKLSHGFGLSWHFVPFIINSVQPRNILVSKRKYIPRIEIYRLTCVAWILHNYISFQAPPPTTIFKKIKSNK